MATTGSNIPSLREIIYEVTNIVYGGMSSDDKRLGWRIIEKWAEEYRSLLISQAMSKRQDISTIWIQTPVVEMELIDTTLPTTIIAQETSDCVILRSKTTIPRTIEYYGDNNVLSVQTIDGKKSFSKINFFRSKYSKFSKYTGFMPKWYVLNDYLYIQNNVFIEKVLVPGLYESPREVGYFMDVKGSPVWTEDSPYPASKKMIEQIVELIVKERTLLLKQMVVQTTNEGRDTTVKTNGLDQPQPQKEGKGKQQEE